MKKTNLFEADDDDDLESPKKLLTLAHNSKSKNLSEFINELKNTNEQEAPEKLVEIQVDPIIIEDSEDEGENQSFQDFRTIQVVQADHEPLGDSYCNFDDHSYCFHRWRTESNHSEDFVLWSLDPVILRDEKIILIPPSWPEFGEDIVEDETGSFASWYANLLRRLTENRESIGEAMVATIDVSETYSVQIADLLLLSIRSSNATFQQMITRLHLVSDILYNLVCVIKTTNQLAGLLEKRIPDMIQTFADLYFSVPGRISANTIKRSVFELINLWEKWSVLPRLLCQNLRFLFTEESRVVLGEDDHPAEEPVDGHPLDTSLFHNDLIIDEELDGLPIL